MVALVLANVLVSLNQAVELALDDDLVVDELLGLLNLGPGRSARVVAEAYRMRMHEVLRLLRTNASA